MKRLIYADDFDQEMYEEAFNKDNGMQKWDSGLWIRYKLYERVMDAQPTIDAVPVKRGMWTFIRLTDKDYGHKAKECSSCGSTFFDTKQWNYCPNCGADMRGEE